MPIKISAPKVKVPERPKDKKLPKVLERPKDKKLPLVLERPRERKTTIKTVSERVRPMVTQEIRPRVISPTKTEKKKSREPSPERKKNDRNAANPRPGSV